MAWLSRSAVLALDATDPPPVHAVDPDDDYLLALAVDYPIAGPADFLATILGAND